jgi:hypothetical protein
MDAEVSTHTFIPDNDIEESVLLHVWWTFCFLCVCVQLFLCGTHGIYFLLASDILFSSTEQCAWAIISPKEFKTWVTCVSFALFTGKQNYLLLNILRFALKICFERFFNVMQLILVKIKWHKWKYIIQKSHDIFLSY